MLPDQRGSHATSIVFKWVVCRSLTEVALDDLDPDHFAAWTKQGWALGNLSSVHINVEVGGGMGSIQFPVANVTT
ncbi:MAG TPA: hypothetical protein VGF76_20770, partial [Polyangiaceae bacterium]